MEQDFNSLHAQREACAAFVASQKHEGWVLLNDAYDDGGLSGGTLERPALQRLMGDIDAGKVDQIIVYKIDRLTRSLADFAKLVERLDRAGASFVSVTQSFNTATSMGRLTLNVLLSFAQFEREVTAERIRDKIAASKRKGLWMGGLVPFGFEADGRTLRIREDEAKVVRELFTLYLRLGSARAVHEEAAQLGFRSRLRLLGNGKTVGGGGFSRGHIHQMLSNPIYVGRIRHKHLVHDGLHPAIVSPEIWDNVQAMLAGQAGRDRGQGNSARASPFARKLFDETGDRLTPSHANKKGIRHRYYVSHRLVRQSGVSDPSGWRLPARPLEQAITTILSEVLGGADFIAGIITDLSVAEMMRLRDSIAALAKVVIIGDEVAVHRAADLIAKVIVAPDSIAVALDAAALSSALGFARDRIAEEQLVVSRPLRLRRRGVETRLVLGEPRPETDATLIRNIARAHVWLASVQQGRSFDEIADQEGVSKNRLQQMIHLAFLAPDIVADIVAGKQPIGLTTEWLRAHELLVCWDDQRRLFAAL